MAMERTRSKSNFSFFRNPAMERTNGAVDDEHCPKSVNSPAIFRGTPSSSFHSFLALSIGLGGIHLTCRFSFGDSLLPSFASRCLVSDDLLFTLSTNFSSNFFESKLKQCR